jgi:phenylacetate-CoA ligase
MIIAAFNANVIDCGQMAEMTPFMNILRTVGTDGILLGQIVVCTKVCYHNAFERKPFGQRGTPVDRKLSGPRSDDPARLGQLNAERRRSHALRTPITTISERAFGRIDDIFTIRGDNFNPSGIEANVSQFSGYGEEDRILVTSDGSVDELLIQVKVTDDLGTQSAGSVRALRDTAGGRLNRTLGQRAKVELMAPRTLTRNDFDLLRVIDHCDEFREMYQRLTRSGGDV